MFMRSAASKAVAGSSAPRHRELWLLGQPPLQKYVDYFEHLGGDPLVARRQAVDEWRQANEVYHLLEKKEAGLVDRVSSKPLPASLESQRASVVADPRYQASFGELPNRIALVELDTLIVPQSFINLDHSDRLRQRLKPKPTAAELFDFCLPLNREEAPVHARQIGRRKYLFWSHSSDFRFQDLAILDPGKVANFHNIGPAGKIIAVSLGYGSNFLSVIESDNRVLLHNGHHRAHALRAAGVKWAPAIIQTVTRSDELNLTASGNVIEDPAFFFKYPRPPLLKDYFDARVTKILEVKPVVRTIEVSIEINEYETADFAMLG